jgi:hypothetical protein
VPEAHATCRETTLTPRRSSFVPGDSVCLGTWANAAPTVSKINKNRIPALSQKTIAREARNEEILPLADHLNWL